jgi:glyceraldehyde 3-phosphate dehydrogenase
LITQFEITASAVLSAIGKCSSSPRRNSTFATAGPLAGILGCEDRPLVSADYTDDTRGSIVDGPSTMVTDGILLKVYAWYDNEVGYACRMIDLANIVIERGI